MRLYNPFPAARWLRNSLDYIDCTIKNRDEKFVDEFVFVVTKMSWRMIPFE